MNFGDWIGPFLYRARTGRMPAYRKPSDAHLTTTLATVGSLMELVAEDCVVWGSGILFAAGRVRRPHDTLAVRGPLTHARYRELGYPCPRVFGDPAILLPRYLDGAKRSLGSLAVVPNFKHISEARRLFGNRANVTLVDPRRSVEEVVAELTSFEHVAASSLHGLIVSHAYGIPAVRIEFEGAIDGDGTKYDDYYMSGGVTAPPAPVLVTEGIESDELCERARRAPVPDLDALVPQLVDCCPF